MRFRDDSYLDEWHLAFATLPVRVKGVGFVWLEWVERRRWTADDFGDCFEYRVPTATGTKREERGG